VSVAGANRVGLRKRETRMKILTRAGIEVGKLHTIDHIDAALCALAASCFAARNFAAYGNAASGFIIVPANPLAALGTGELRSRQNRF
jgi:predicted RNase H-like nuclease